MTKINKEWENIGDVNPLDHGGFFIKEDEDYPREFHVIVLVNLEESVGESGYRITDGYVDLNDDYIDWKAIKEYSGHGQGDDLRMLVYAIESYYGVDGHSWEVETREEAINELEPYGVVLN